ncbi:hypothetical protein BOX15_Mlig023966g1 [Macrostomum lignano]|uniref:Alpha-type protein kinase domain-containing protein n=2 Tax=Macrostomum lignano TaxID=282301 RepID=A0A1I8IM49_9PLAT|nr:hypothetical protein BOX15_Mlig023966g2 [Macrostomum lignano]PAA71503.1 hypothetical protein BOX15_Mlig023966g1 [Macrostomum lignano]
MGSSMAQAAHQTAELDSTIDGAAYLIDFQERPFSNGSCRLAFQGVYRGRGPLNGKRCVAKVAIATCRHGGALADYEADMQASRKAGKLAELFNKEFVSSKPLRFVQPAMATVLTTGSCYSRRGDKILVEEFIEGRYEKFNNNAHYQSDEVATVPCFSHYTYYKTGGRYLVCDIQGVRTSRGYWLTDPAVHSREGGKFGDTDLGRDGFVRFFSSHRCTSVCILFPISDLKAGQDLPEASFNLTRKNYCGRRLNGPPCDCCDGSCGPRNGCNCCGCMRRDLEEFGLLKIRALVNREGAVSRLSSETNKFYCGRKNMARDRMTDGFCGPNNGNNCHACRQLDIQSRDRYYLIVQAWFGKALPEPTSIVHRA